MQLIGREAEQAVLDAALLRRLEQRTAGAGAVLIEGVSGIGKSALVDSALRTLAAARPDVRIGRGCAGGASDLPYHPFIECLAGLAGAEATRDDSFADLARELAPDWLGVLPFVGGVLSAGFATAARLRARQVNPLTAPAESLFLQYLRLIQRLSETGPLVLFIDDAHAADPGSAALIAHLCRALQGTPFALLAAATAHSSGTALSLVVPELERERLLQRLRLDELDAGAVSTLVEAQLGAPAAPSLGGWAASRAGGNPRDIRDLLERLGRDGDMLFDDGCWRLVSTPDRSASTPVLQEMQRRVSDLDPETQRLLEHAAAQGTEFSPSVLADTLGAADLAVLDAIAELEHSRGLLRTVAADAVYRFVDRSLHDVVLSGIRPLRRRILDARVTAVVRDRAASAGHVDAGDASRVIATPLAAADDSGTRPVAAPSRFVGRDRELAQLGEAISRTMTTGRGCALFVQGGPGAGKTTLVTELLQRVTSQNPELAIGRGRCLQTFDRADPYLPFTDALRDLSDESTAGYMPREALSALLTDVAPYWLNALPVIGGVLSASFNTARGLRDSGAAPRATSRELLLGQYLEVIRRLSQRRPLLLLIDDIHWIDHASADLLARLVEGVEDMPVILLGALRPLDDSGSDQPAAAVLRRLQSEAASDWIDLGELTGNAFTALITSEMGADVSEPLQRWIASTAGGNPLFAGELCRLMRETGAAVLERGEWELTDRVHGLGVPRSAEAVIEARIQRLDHASVRLLQYASVEGNQFSTALLARLLEQHEHDVMNQLTRLAEAHRLVAIGGTVELPDGAVTHTVHFHHALIQTVLYAQVTGRRRVLLHRRAGNVLEQLYSSAPAGIASRLAQHFNEGDVPDAAFRYARIAADSARAVYAHWEAEELLRIARAHAASSHDIVEIEETLGDIYDLVGYYPRGIEAYARALERANTHADHIRLERKVLFLDWKSASSTPPALVARIRALLAAADDLPTERCRLLLELGRFRNESDAMAAVAEAVRIADEASDAALLAQALEQLAVAFVFGGMPADALPHLQRARETAGEDDPVRAALNRNITGVAFAKLGRYRESQHAFEQMLAVVERIGHQNGIATACNNIGHMLLRLGELDAAETALQRAVRIHERRDRVGVVQSLFNLGERARRAHEYDLAADRYEAMFSAAREAASAQAVARAGLGLSLFQLGHYERARECAAECALLLDETSGWFEDRELCDILNARIAALDGNDTLADTQLRNTAALLYDSDRFVWGSVELERARIVMETQPGRAVDIVQNVAANATGNESALDDEIQKMLAALTLRQYDATQSGSL